MASLVIAASMVVSACSGGTATADPVLETVAPVAAHEPITANLATEDFVLLDVRTPEECNEVRIDGSVNLDFYAADFAERLAELDRSVNYVVYCNSGNRSGTTLDMMTDLGFTTVHNVDAGIVEWYADGCLEEKLGYAGRVKDEFPNAAAFVDDVERWWNLYQGMGLAKRIQAPPILAVKRRAFGFDHREAQLGPLYTQPYLEMKASLLK